MDGYRRVREGAAIGALAPREAIGISGADRLSYLQGLLTNDIQALVPGTGCYAAWLTPQGRMLTDMHVLESGSMVLMDVPAGELDATLQRLDQFIFTEEVRVESLAPSLRSVWIHGPQAPSCLDAVFGAAGFAGWAPYHHEPLTCQELPVVVARIDQVGVPGYCLFVQPSGESRLLKALAEAGASVVEPAALEAARIEAGYPVFGVDMTGDTIPLEAGIEPRAISFTKGCYVGQEVIVRVLHRGGGRVAKRLVGLRVHGEVPARGALVFAAGREVGRITSAAASPALGTVALGYLHRDFVAAGTTVEVDTPFGRAPAVVTDRPMR